MKRVNKMQRDGTKKSKSGSDEKQSEKNIKNAGARSHGKGTPRYGNPCIGDRAKLWTHGWNVAHGECKGCELCLVGNKKIKDPFVVLQGG